jgi:hypothetical protein
MIRFPLVALLILGARAAPLWAGGADSAQKERHKVLEAMKAAAGYLLEVRVKGVEGVVRLQIKDIRSDHVPFFKKLAADQWVADHSMGKRILPYVLACACGGPGRGSARVDVLLARQDFLRWPYAEEASEEFQRARAKQRKASRVEITAELLPAMKVAKARYDERRAELIGRLCRSLLFYPPAQDLHWLCERDGDHLFVSASCGDRMFSAFFTVVLERAEGNWHYRRLLGTEVCRGE